MKLSELKKAIACAKRFIIAAEEVEMTSIDGSPYKNQVGRTGDAYVSGKYVATAKRASLDLTRQLADLRRN